MFQQSSGVIDSFYGSNNSAIHERGMENRNYGVSDNNRNNTTFNNSMNTSGLDFAPIHKNNHSFANNTTHTAGPSSFSERAHQHRNTKAPSSTTSTSSFSTGHLNTPHSSSYVECSPFLSSSSLLAFGDTHITVGRINTRQDHDTNSKWSFNHLVDIHHPTEVECIAWSPLSFAQASDDGVAEGCKVALCVAGSDRKLRFYQTLTPSDELHQVTLQGHEEGINAIAFSTIAPEVKVASTGDDNTCRVWDLEAQTQLDCFRLSSPGTSVCWHPDRPYELVVSEINGQVKMIDLRSGAVSAMLHLDATPVVSCDWNPHNALQIGVVAGTEWFVWDVLRGPGRMNNLQRSHAHTDGARHFRWCRSNPSIFATGSDFDVSVWDIQHSKLGALSTTTQTSKVNGLSWFGNTNCLVTGGNRKIHLNHVGTSAVY